MVLNSNLVGRILLFFFKIVVQKIDMVDLIRDKEEGIFQGVPVLLNDYEELDTVLCRSVSDPTRNYLQDLILRGLILFPDHTTKSNIMRHILDLCPRDKKGSMLLSHFHYRLSYES